MSTVAGRVDVHHHIVPADHRAEIERRGLLAAAGAPFPSWDAQGTLAMLDRQGIAAAVTSITSPGVHFGDDAASCDLARRCNDASARLVADHPTRFGAFAILPLPDVKGALLETERALDVLGFDGVVLLSSHSDGSYPGDPRFDELMAELDRRSAVAFVHPTIPKTSEGIGLGVPGFVGEFTFDTTRAAMNLIWTGTVERFPNVRFILSHAGGTTPYLAQRINLMSVWPEFRERAPRGALHYLKRFFYDTALSVNPNALRSLQELVGPEQILFGSDFPFAPEPIARASIEGLARYDGFDASARARIERENALALLPRLAARLGAAA
jgi:predicted TIM-barrel fold metal-dependent hydrolase